MSVASINSEVRVGIYQVEEPLDRFHESGSHYPVQTFDHILQ